MAGDLFYQATIFGAHGTGVDGSTALVDSSKYGYVPSVLGTAKIDASQSKWGGGAAYVDGVSGHWALPGSTNIVLSPTTAGSIDMWFRMASFGKSYGCLVANGLASFAAAQSPAGLMVFGDSVGASARRIALLNPTYNPLIQSATGFTLNLGQWYYVMLSWGNGTVYLWIDGVLHASATIPGSFVFSADGTTQPLVIGRNGWDGANGYLNAWINDIRITLGAMRDGSVVPTGPFDLASSSGPWATGYQGVAQRILGAAPLTSYIGLKLPTVRRTANMALWGTGYIHATVKEKNTPANTPLQRRVRLYRERDGLFIAETWSDPVTGNYAFDNIDPHVRYTVVSYDHANNYRAVIADNLPVSGVL